MHFRAPSSLPEDVKKQVADLLQPLVLALGALSGVAYKAHWNVKGHMFGPLHGYFGDLYEACDKHKDALAEHISLVLGCPVEGDHMDVAAGGGVTGMPSTLTAGRDLARAIGDRVTQVLEVLRAPQGQLVALGDNDAQQKVLDASMAISKIGGFILAHLG